MNIDRIISLFRNPSQLDRLEVSELQEIIRVYPFFTHTRVLLTKKMQLSQHLLLKKEIKKTAISIPNRKGLYTFLYKKDIQNTIIQSQKEIATNDPVQEEPNTSSFSSPVTMDSSKKPASKFKIPVDLKQFGKPESKTMDLLEQQIIGQTIEHVLSQEIANSKKKILVPSEKRKNTPKESQKFSDWLTILDQDRLHNWRNKEANPEIQSGPTEDDIINSFLEKDTNVISPTNDNIEYSPSNLARLSIVDDEAFVTETLAKIYLDQGNLSKALTAYTKLLLKYPEKKTYFAAQIDKIEQELK